MYKLAFLAALLSLNIAHAIQVIPQSSGWSSCGSGFAQGFSGSYYQTQQDNYYRNQHEEQMQMMREQVRMQQEALRLMKYGY